ncbi:DsRNA binding PKR inhibitor [Moosepox virus GoldyGopher14]|nr:DsRNA binding PKR inhibitor [Moosepox virus GoldyGopher14]
MSVHARGCNYSDMEITKLVKDIITNLPLGRHITALEIARQLNVEKSYINKQLYKLYHEGLLNVIPTNPPRWLKKTCTKEEEDVMSVIVETNTYLDELDIETMGKNNPELFGDTIPYEKILAWKDKNPCSVLNEYCQYTSRDWYIDIISSGPIHKPLFTATLCISGVKFRSAIGSTKKEAKTNATRMAMDLIINNSIIKF